MATILNYKTTEGGALLTDCPIYDCKIGGYYCVNCRAHSYKDMDKKIVACSRVIFDNVGGLPPQRITEKQLKRKYGKK